MLILRALITIIIEVSGWRFGGQQQNTYHFGCSYTFAELDYLATIFLYSWRLDQRTSLGYQKYSISVLGLRVLRTSAAIFLSLRIKPWQKKLKSSASFNFLKQTVAIPLFSPFERTFISINSTVPQSLATLSNSSAVIQKSIFLTLTAFLVLRSLAQLLARLVFSSKGWRITRCTSSLVTIKSSLYFSTYFLIASSVQNLNITLPVACPTLFFTTCICQIFFREGSICAQISFSPHPLGKQCPYATQPLLGSMEFCLASACVAKRKRGLSLIIIIMQIVIVVVWISAEGH